MALSQRLELKLGRHLAMTPQLRQAIQLLELSHQDLNAYIQAELESNPFLEKDENWQANLDDKSPDGGANSESYGENWRSETSLSCYLQEQINLDIADQREKLIAQQLIHQLDENGYLIADLEEMAARLRISSSAIEGVLKKLQQLEPPGIFARNLRECLELQLADKNRLDPLMQRLLDRLDLVAGKEYAKLRQWLKIEDEDLMDMMAELRSLDPKPGFRFGAAPIQSFAPDILVIQNNDGSWMVELNPAVLPRLIVNRDYRVQISANKEEKSYLSEKVAKANWLVRALDQRAQTILRVAKEIIRRQEGFLINGLRHFRPLLRRDIAMHLHLHESTVSRVTANKYMATPKGIFALADFFGNGLGADQAISAKSVMYLIKKRIEGEKCPLSDEQLAIILKEKGIDVARRTIAKYRKLMKIPSSSQRRKDKSLPFAQGRLHQRRGERKNSRS